MTRKPNRELKKNEGKSEIRRVDAQAYSLSRVLALWGFMGASGSVNAVSSSTSSQLEYTVDIDTLR